MLKKELVKALNSQFVFELYSAYVYLGLSAVLEKMKMPGAAHWMKIQADEELIHANLFFAYLTDQSEEVILDAIAKPMLSGISTPLDAFECALHHEKVVSTRINDLAALSMKTGSFATGAFLNFFLTEQIQEERSVQTVIDKMERAGKDEKALIFIDSELMNRPAATPPQPNQGA